MALDMYLFLIVYIASYTRGEDCSTYGYYNITQFGDTCQYRCRCVNEEQCDRLSGNCTTGCASGWMGPGCQYRNIAFLNHGAAQFNAIENMTWWATDGNISTCVSGMRIDDQRLFWRIHFLRAYYIVGLILKFQTVTDVAIQIDGSNDTSFDDIISCYNRTDPLSRLEIEMMCVETMNVQFIRIMTFQTSEMVYLCEAEIYGGRYISYRGSASQSSTFNTWPNGTAAVDGRPMLDGDFQEDDANRTCSVTKQWLNQYWQLKFSTEMFLIGIHVYGRRLLENPEYNSQIAGFSIDTIPVQINFSLIYTDVSQNTNWTYYQPRSIELDVPRLCTGVKINKKVDHLSLCEVEVFAECPQNQCGWNCSDVCHCSTVTTGSYRKEGRCPYGCSPRWKGENGRCDTPCTNDTWGFTCERNCFCFGGAQCEFENGKCPGECDIGWSGLSCNETCKNGMHGRNCNESCGKCKYNVQCNATTGNCPDGCAPGWKGGNCTEHCSEDEYGFDCNEKCGHCKDGEPCNNTDGRCPRSCDPGWQAPLCKKSCTDKKYGFDCNEECGHCKDGEPCNHMDGHCPHGCDPGWQAPLCKKKSLGNYDGHREYGDNHAGAIVGSIMTILVVAAVFVGITIYTRKRRINSLQDLLSCVKFSKSAESQHSRGIHMVFESKKDVPQPTENEQKECSIVLESDGHLYMNKDDLFNPILSSKLKQYCQNIKIDPSPVLSEFQIHIALFSHGNRAFKGASQIVIKNITDSSRTDDMPAGRQFATNRALTDSNAHKNRYRELYPYDKNAVSLPSLPGIPDSDYISASYIDGFEAEKRYIASQGAMKTTVADIWRMIWSHDIDTIVMLTRCYELGKLKCEQYWPSESSEKYGEIQVKLELEDFYSEHVTRTFEIRKAGTSNIKHTTQYHFISWPDKDVPDDTLSLVQFWRCVKQREIASKNPWMVHCSAGIGRTGTFIALDYLYDQGKAEGRIDVKACVRNLRNQRVNMVQTQDQYVFVHHAVQEALNPVGNAFYTEDFHDNWKVLTATRKSYGADELLRQYKAMSDDSEDTHTENEYASFNTFFSKDEFKGSLKQENIGKSRRPDILPPDRYRPILGVTEDYQDDYINAVYLSSFRMKDGLILNQLPLTSTVVDTLRLIWQCNTSCIVIMENSIPEESIYWPDAPHTVKTFGTFSVQLESEESDRCVIKRRMKISRTITDDVKDIVQIHYRLWPDMLTVPENSSSILRLVSDAETTMRIQGKSNRLLVQCLDGATRSGLFSVMWSILERIKSDNTLAIADTVRQARVRRKQIIPNCEQYRFCWETVREHLENADVYGNVL